MLNVIVFEFLLAVVGTVEYNVNDVAGWRTSGYRAGVKWGGMRIPGDDIVFLRR
jgi:hypothetical protein